MKKLIKILTFSLFITSFYLQAMQEVKEDAEGKEVELRELKRRFPHSINFLIKVLGAQKSKEKTLLEKINPLAKGESEVIKKGLPADIILKIINDYLRIDLVKHTKNNKDGLTYKINKITRSTDVLDCTFDDIDYMHFFPMRRADGSEEYVLSNGKIKTIDDEHRRFFRADERFFVEVDYDHFKFMDNSILDINPKYNNFEIIVQNTKNNKYKIVAGFVGIGGLAYYLIKKLKK